MSMFNIIRASALTASLVVLSASTAGAQEFVLHFRDGLVTLVAHDVTVPTILNWWGRLGSATVVNAEKIEGPPVSLQLVDVPEREALAILLRDVGGYILAARHESLQGVSVFDRILVVQPSASAVRNSPPQLAQFTGPSTAPEVSETEHGVAGQSAEPGPSSPLKMPVVPGAAPFATQGPFASQGNTSGKAGLPFGTSIGTARPGEATAPPPTTRISPGPQRPPQ